VVRCRQEYALPLYTLFIESLVKIAVFKEFGWLFGKKGPYFSTWTEMPDGFSLWKELLGGFSFLYNMLRLLIRN